MDTDFDPRGTALVVVDDGERRSLAAAILEEVHARVFEAASPDEALRLLEACSEGIDFAFVDLADPSAALRFVDRLARGVPAIRTACAWRARHSAAPDADMLTQPWRALDLLIAAERAALEGMTPVGRGPFHAVLDRPSLGYAR